MWTAKRLGTLCLWLFVVMHAASAAAETSERELRGWTGTGSEFVVRDTESGTRMVDGVSRDYWYRTTELWSVHDGTLVRRFKLGDATGAPPPEYQKAAPQAEADKYLKTVGLVEARTGVENSTGTRRLVWFARNEVAASGKKFVCTRHQRLALLDGTTQRVWTLADKELAGDPATRRDEADCPSVAVQPAWSPNGEWWALLVSVDGDLHLYAGTADGLDDVWAGFAPRQAAIVDLTSGDEQAGWNAFSSGDIAGAQQAFSAAGQAGAAALCEAYSNPRRGRRAADHAWRKSSKTPFDEALRAAAYTAAGEPGRTKKWLDHAADKAGSYAELLKMAAMFELVDVGVANQLAVHALSHPSAAQADTTAGWILLGQGLIASGDFSKAREALGHVTAKDKPPEFLVEQARLQLDLGHARDAAELADEILFEHPGRCVGYLIGGRARSLSGDNTAARDLFGAAAFCDPNLGEALYYVADFDRLAGDLGSAETNFRKYLAVATPRRDDAVRAARRKVAKQWADRFGHTGIVITDASCRRVSGALVCSGVLQNTGTSPVELVPLVALQGSKVVGQASVEKLAPHTPRSFAVRVTAKSTKDLHLQAGLTRAEKKLNDTPVH